jgi:1,4-alpha-glucan branching enzyme
VYGGSGVGNLGRAFAESTPLHGQPATLAFTLPPLAMVLFTDQPHELSPPPGVPPHARH